MSARGGRRLRVLHVITRLEPGGAQRNTLHTVAHLDRDRFEAGLAWGPGDPLDAEAERLDGVDLLPVPDLVRPVHPAADAAAVVALRRAVRAFGPDVVHTHSSKAGILGRLAARLEGVRAVVHSVHGFGFTPLQAPWSRAAFFAVERLAARWTDHAVFVSRRQLELAAELGLVPAGGGSVIRSGVDLGRAASGDGAAARRALGIPPDAPLAVQIGNFKPQKGPLDLVRVAAGVVRRVPAAVLVAIGDGPLRSAAASLAADLGLAGRLLMPGWTDDVPGLLAAAQVSVLMSRHEGLPRAAVESLAAGVPVVATAVDGTPEVVRDGDNGFLVPPGDVASAADRVSRLLEDAELRARLAAGTGRGLEEFDIARMVRAQEELYRCLSS